MLRLTQSIPFVVVAISAAASPAWSCVKTDTRWSASSNTLYIEAPVSCTLSDLATFVKPEVLERVDPALQIWLLKANLRITGGGSLILHGGVLGGDVDELRLLSPNNPAQKIRINARWGNIDIRSTHIQSWDPASNGPDLDYSNGRSYIHVESILDDQGVPRESRMDIVNSEINDLGDTSAQSYGLVWKVVGDFKAIPDLYDRVGVYGSLIGSKVHHNFMGFYSFGANGINITDNEVSYNAKYGIDPHDDSDYLLIARNAVHDNGNHGIICSKRCNNLDIRDNEVYKNKRHGIMLHREVVDSVIENNHVYDNQEEGIVLLESHRNTIRGNIVENNNNGIRLSTGSHDNTIEGNISRNNTYNALYLYAGDTTPETTDGRPRNNVFLHNIVSNNGRAIKVRDADNNVFTQNAFAGNADDLELNNSTSIDITRNLYASADFGTFTLSDANWGSSSIAWSTSTIQSNQNIEYRITDQVPNATYTILRDGLVIANVSSNDSGLLVFKGIIQPGTYRYEVRPLVP